MRGFDFRRALSNASVYSGFRRIVVEAQRDALVMRRLAVQPGHRVLDIGCGTGDVLEHLPRSVAYVGIDSNTKYIRAAQERHGHRGMFHIHQLGGRDAPELGRFDRVLADGVIHHLDKTTAATLFALAADVLRPGGHLVTIDPCLVDGQGWLARRLLAADRGDYVRTHQDYLELARSLFGDVRGEVRGDLLRLPYNHLLMECRRPTPPTAPRTATR